MDAVLCAPGRTVSARSVAGPWVVRPEDVAWLVAHLRAVVAASAAAGPIIGDTDPDTARRLQAVLTGMSPQTRRHLIDVLIDTVRRSAD